MTKFVAAILALTLLSAEASARSSKRFAGRSGLTTSAPAAGDTFNVKTRYANQLQYIR